MIRIPRAIQNEMIEHARSGFPLEVCGILGGTGHTVSIAYPMTNTDVSSKHFMMDPREQFRVARDLRAKGLAMLAIYHSHPETPAGPSEEDIRLALTPGVSYLIISLADPQLPDLKSFRIKGATLSPEEVVIHD